MKAKMHTGPAADDRLLDILQLVPESPDEERALRRLWDQINYRRLELPMAYYGDVTVEAKEQGGFKLSGVSAPTPQQVEPVAAPA